jgi:hypothetical protein
MDSGSFSNSRNHVIASTPIRAGPLSLRLLSALFRIKKQRPEIGRAACVCLGYPVSGKRTVKSKISSIENVLYLEAQADYWCRENGSIYGFRGNHAPC